MYIHQIPPFNPKADQNAIVISDHARFTILSSRLIRMEYDPQGIFDDRPSQVVWFRNLPVPEFSVNHIGRSIIIETNHLNLTYFPGKKFNRHTLSILLKQSNVVWYHGDGDHANLNGTFRTLDEADGAVDLEPGLMSRSGWSVVDDSKSLVFTQNGWLESRNKSIAYEDLYFFGYVSEYLDCLKEYQYLTGHVPLLPRWALGNWWSRYWRYSQSELLALMDDFESHDIPLSVCIVDMDWHITNTGNTSTGWTGYTWNKDLFPDPQIFIQELHLKNLKTALNLHPAEGIYPHEAVYPQMAKRIGIDPETQQPVPFDIASPDFVSAYFEELHQPLEAQGIDFWWLDWQQGNKAAIVGLDPLFWLNHLHAYQQMRLDSNRPFIFSRWPGLGGHRYPIGFSGDTVVSWKSLDFQPYFTATASNVAFGWWSHDIGGHMDGIEEPELYLRWVQFGVFSPILRLHSTNNPYHERRPWAFDAETEIRVRQAMKLRHRLIPYIYTASWLNEKQGIPLILPMYYINPMHEAAYQCSKQYYFGSELIAAPFTTSADPSTNHSRQVVWLPEGDWFNFFSGEYHRGGGWHAIYGRLGDIPVFAKAGAIIPLSDDSTKNGADNPKSLEIKVFAGANNSYTLYEDDGESLAYRQGDFSTTRFSQEWQPDTMTFHIYPTQGSSTHLPEKRSFCIVVIGIEEPDTIKLLIDGQEVHPALEYDHNQSMLIIKNLVLPIQSEVSFTISAVQGLLSTRNRVQDKIEQLICYAKVNTNIKRLFMDKLPQFLSSPATFIEFSHHFQSTQLLAIYEIIAGWQAERISYDLDEAKVDLYDRFRNFA